MCALLSVLEGVKILKLSLGLLLVCVAIFRVPAGEYGSLRLRLRLRAAPVSVF